jgi:alkylation response protein AidB-like acyl-CoA dehydrogenase
MSTTAIERPSSTWTGTDIDGPWANIARQVGAVARERSAEHDRVGDFVTKEMSLVRESGLVSMLVPEQLGGGGATYAETCAALALLAQGCPATALTLSMHTHLVAAQVWRHKHDLPAPVLQRVAKDQVLLVSTGAADWVSSNGIATPVDGGFRVTARKTPSSGAPVGDIVVSSARWESGPDGAQVIHFSVPFATEGVSIDETWDTMGMRATGSHTVVLHEVFVPEAAVSLTRPADRWHPVWNTVMGVAMPLIMSVYVGIAEAASDLAIELARVRSDQQLVLPLVGRMLSRLSTVQDTVGAMVAMSDDLHFANTDQHASAVLMRKTTAAEGAIDTVRLAMDVAGGAGYLTATGLERLYRDVHGALYHPLPAVKQEPFCGRVALGLDPIG